VACPAVSTLPERGHVGRPFSGSCIVVEAARLSPVVQGVEFIVVEQGVRIRALILRDALERFFGADDTPSSWLRAYQDHRDTIDCAAADRYRSDSGRGVIVLRGERADDFAFARQLDLR
jgi:hypothetical protein